jgi:hypothetical protein
MKLSMFSVGRDAVAEDSLLRTYQGGTWPERWGRYGDCFSLIAERRVSLTDFVFAFYTSPVFRIERFLLGAFAGAASSDSQARAVADGSAASFALWYVGERTATQLLMCDRYERTRSWFRVVALDRGRTLLQFGSAVAATGDDRTGDEKIGGTFRWLVGFHVLYSQVLLHAAKVGMTQRGLNTGG